MQEADGVYRESAAMDRMRIYEWDGIDIPADDQAEMDRQRLVRGIVAGATRDPVLGRALLRRMNLVEPPERVLDDPEVVDPRAAHAGHPGGQGATEGRAHPGRDARDPRPRRPPIEGDHFVSTLDESMTHP